MKLLLKFAFILAACFAATFVIIKATGVLSIDDIKAGFDSLHSSPAYMIGGLVALLLFIDLFIAIPTLTVIILSGYFLGFAMGAGFALVGLASAALTGYGLSLLWGDKLINKLSKDELQKQQMRETFQQHGVLVLIMSRAMPILPELSACLAGSSRMPLSRFIFGWSVGTIPYVLLATYAGSISSLDKPMPAIMTALGISATLWLVWAYILRRRVQPRAHARNEAGPS